MGAKQPQPKICEHDGLVHDALLYRGVDELTAAVLDFVEQGADAGEAALIALPGRRARTVRAALQAQGAEATVVDMAQLGRNPGRIMPFVRQFVSDARRPRPVRRRADLGGPRACGDRRGDAPRGAAEPRLRGHRHPDPLPLRQRARSRTTCSRTPSGRTRRSWRAACAARAAATRAGRTGCAAGSRPLPDFGKPQGELEFERGDLSLVRSVVRRQTERTTLLADACPRPAARGERGGVQQHRPRKPSGGRLRVWQIGEGVVCEVADAGRIADPLAGRTRPAADAEAAVGCG